MSDDDKPETRVYWKWHWDCPCCGSVFESDEDPVGEMICEDCCEEFIIIGE